MGTVHTKFFSYGSDEIEYLTRADATLGAAIARLGKVERECIPDLFAALVHAIVAQLISAKAAHTIWLRMQEQLGAITPENVASHPVEAIRGCGLTLKKAACIHAIARSIIQGELKLDELRDRSDAEVINALTAINGVGKWTAEMLLIHSLERRDIVSWGDVAIRRGMCKLYGLDALTPEQFASYCRAYSPYGSIASIYLWRISFDM